ncbi:SpoIIE family protein phosphatase [Streptomyces sp. HNM0574]|uniref:SpoIIE family protein phosphatase n=1 Tax=Streptomyces sp. HNM0574 TaxID=2714954 RepID=UPI001F10B620|nr:SpoIIE family protein phosphatase [Streptomyces sp. HNM0574]
MGSVAGQVLVLQVGLVVLLVAAAVSVLVLQARHDSRREAEHRARAVAETFAQAPSTLRALDSAHPETRLQPVAEEVRKRAGVDYVVVFNTDGIRYTHPDPDRIGKHVVGSLDETLRAARRGESFSETLKSPQGEAVDTSAPITRPDGSLAAVVSAGMTVDRVNTTVERQLPMLVWSTVGTLVLAALGAWVVSRRLRRQTHGLGPAEMTRMYEHHDAVLHAVREGVLIVGEDGRLLLVNDEARRLLDLPKEAEGRRVDGLGLDTSLTALLTGHRAVTDKVCGTGGRLLVVNVRRTAPYGGVDGSVITLRDTTELRALTGLAEVARERLELLYEAGVRIGTTLDVERTARELTEVAVPRFADYCSVELMDPVLRGEEPPGFGTTLRRVALLGVREETPFRPEGELMEYSPTGRVAEGVAAGRAVLEADLASSAEWLAQSPEPTEAVLAAGVHSLIVAPLRARGVVLGLARMWRAGDSPAYSEDDVSFAEELIARAAVCTDNARRYTREHATAVTLQRSLLPRALPEQSALEVAHRYQPSQAGVGGDWFDVIPLPGARVALVVGDVVGHGLHATATMGRLRTAVYNFSALDLPPDELLAHLDELVAHVDEDEGGGESDGEGDSPPLTGATCLYAVYDPASGVCTVARAGHPGPVLAHPDGRVSFPEVPLSPPLGVGGLPFETAELRLTEDTRIVLYTNGLVENRERDVDTGVGMLAEVLRRHPGLGPEQTCRALLEALLPPRPDDDVALLVARTRVLDPDRVAEWDVPDDPAAVAPLRAACAERLEQWGLGETGLTTELILSELVTNAIRYGTEPIRLRLLYDTNALICEVSDGSNTSPHLRRAATMDEGGRGLFLVAQFARRWGTRYTSRGKIIWTEQALHGEAPAPGAGLSDDALLDQWDDPEL